MENKGRSRKKEDEAEAEDTEEKVGVMCNGLGKGYDEEEEDKKPCFYSPKKISKEALFQTFGFLISA